MHCFKDMTARDLLQRRATDAQGNTRWEPSPLLRTAWAGGLLVLDGLHRLKPEVLCSLASLLQDGSTQLFDGERLLRRDQFLSATEAVAAAAAESAARPMRTNCSKTQHARLSTTKSMRVSTSSPTVSCAVSDSSTRCTSTSKG